MDNGYKFNAIGKKVTLTIRGNNSDDLKIETFVRDQFFHIKYILRCDIKKYIIDLLNMTSDMSDNLTIVHMEIEGFTFHNFPIELHCDKNTILPIMEIVVQRFRENDLRVYNAYIDKISYQATYNILGNL